LHDTTSLPTSPEVLGGLFNRFAEISDGRSSKVVRVSSIQFMMTLALVPLLQEPCRPTEPFLHLELSIVQYRRLVLGTGMNNVTAEYRMQDEAEHDDDSNKDNGGPP